MSRDGLKRTKNGPLLESLQAKTDTHYAKLPSLRVPNLMLEAVMKSTLLLICTVFTSLSYAADPVLGARDLSKSQINARLRAEQIQLEIKKLKDEEQLIHTNQSISFEEFANIIAETKDAFNGCSVEIKPAADRLILSAAKADGKVTQAILDPEQVKAGEFKAYGQILNNGDRYTQVRGEFRAVNGRKHIIEIELNENGTARNLNLVLHYIYNEQYDNAFRSGTCLAK